MPHAVPQQKPQHEPDLMGEEIERILRAATAADAPRPRPVASPPPASSAGPPAIEMWGPNNPRVTTPLELLMQVTENTTRLHDQLGALMTKITGERPPQRRVQQVPMKASGLLPAISLLAHEIEAAHSDIARLIAHVDRQI